MPARVATSRLHAVALAEGICTWVDDEGWTATGMLRSGRRALLINAVRPELADALSAQGVQFVDRVLFTHHRREMADGLDCLREQFAPKITAPAAERRLFEAPDDYWAAPESRWNLLIRHVPYHVTHTEPIPVHTAVKDGDEFDWCGFRIRVLSTPGWTDGAVTYLVEPPDRNSRVAFVGDLVFGDGRLVELYPLQHFEERGQGRVGDYHGWLGSAAAVLAGLDRVLAHCPSVLAPAHGRPIPRPEQAVNALRERLRRLYANYASVSALRWYFPEYFGEWGAGEDAVPQQATYPPPPDVRHVQAQTWMLVSSSRRALLMDPCSEQAVSAAAALLDAGEIASIDGIWITHFHSDHTGAVNRARERFRCPVFTEEHVAAVLTTPESWLLTCLAPEPIHIDRSLPHGASWRWENFTLTAWHLPGQTLYHGGLSAVGDDGTHYLFVGDSFTPTGIDDYCMWNRNFLGRDHGFHACLRLVRQLNPTFMFNPHVNVAFRFSQEAIRHIDRALVERARLIRQVTPWPHADFATDEYWVHCYPYEQRVAPGDRALVAVHVRNAAARQALVRAALHLPKRTGWQVEPAEMAALCPGGAEIRLDFTVQAPAETAGRFVLPVSIHFGKRFLGRCREAIVRVA